MKQILLCSISLVVVACNQPVQTTTTATTTATAVAPIATSEPSVDDRLANASSLEEAWDICSPMMTDTHNELSEGGIHLAVWGTQHMSWDMVSVKKDETTPGMVFKNSHSQLGKRICSVGQVVEIHETRSGVATGEIMGYSGTTYHFYTVGSSGSIVQLSVAHICGYVVGVHSYSNSGGGTTHTVDIVGMWDLNYHPAPDYYQ